MATAIAASAISNPPPREITGKSAARNLIVFQQLKTRVSATKGVSSVCQPLPPDRPLWFPGSSPPPWLDGSIPGDFGFDPLGLDNQNKEILIEAGTCYIIVSSALKAREGKTMAGTVSGDVKSDSYDLRSLLCSDKRDFLVHNNGDQVKIGDLDGKIVGLYFSASWCPPCQRFTPNFAEVYDEFSARWRFEVVYVSKDRDEESFTEYYSHMPWLAVPFSDLKTRKRLSRSFITKGIPHLVILDGNGKVITTNGVGIIADYFEERSLFIPESIEELVAKEVAARDAQSLASILVSGSRDFLISSNGNKVPVSELEGKIVGLYFAVNSYNPCKEFTPKLVKFYRELKGKGERFEIVFVSLDEDEDSFKEQFDGMPWLALPFNNKECMKLTGYFELDDIPMLTIIGHDGKTMNHNVFEIVDEHGIEAYPFTAETIAGLAEIMKARRESQTLESLLITSVQDSIIGRENIEVPVSGLIGRNILLFFAAKWCRRSLAFLPKLIKSYHEIKEKDPAFEVIFISMDQDQASFESFFSDMPWLALPFHDNSRKTFSRAFEIETTPTLIAIGPDGRTITKDARDLLLIHGSDAYPFDKHHSKQLQVSLEEMALKEVKHAAHVAHALVLTRRDVYTCDGCEIKGHMWSFYCEECEFDLHPMCGLEQGNRDGNEEHDDHVHGDGLHELEGKDEGYICDGDVCYKV